VKLTVAAIERGIGKDPELRIRGVDNLKSGALFRHALHDIWKH